MTCNGPDCRRPAAKAGLCWGHRWQQRQGRPLTPIRRGSPESAPLRAAALAYALADSDTEFRRAEARLRMAAIRYGRRKAPKGARGGSAEQRPNPGGSSGGDEEDTSEATDLRQA